ncbi:hypothetical protein SAMN04488021_13045 [Paracoccus aminovorans]|uniref:Uncharacterized protein n=1 Tax=Paracoccus aminovorans TaxID=34004 RepID=A0A1I3CFI8_9RHOB|nr:hypothetical protein [Paracoccus aminovorans]CQR85272.1 hypothetical protein JCM7685_0691 [Paracoccus aminovorans]SFH73272.1 hypothetical protein SAMN04488021_13045 [Paracoccus aminovorans]
MIRSVSLTDALSGLTEVFQNPPWHLDGISQHVRGSLVKLRHDDGRERMIPVKLGTTGLDERFAGWTGGGRSVLPIS